MASLPGLPPWWVRWKAELSWAPVPFHVVSEYFLCLSSQVVNATAQGSKRDPCSSRDPDRSYKASSDLTMEALLPSCSFYILLLKQITKARTVLREKKIRLHLPMRVERILQPSVFCLRQKIHGLLGIHPKPY